MFQFFYTLERILPNFQGAWRPGKQCARLRYVEKDESRKMMPAFPVDHAAILVGSLERSMAYYRTLLPLLGFAERPDGLWSNRGGFSLKFAEAEPGRRPYDRHGAGLNHLGFAAADREAVLAVASGMAAAGFEVPEIQEFGETAALFMRDPDGLRFELSFQATAESPSR